MRWPMMGGLATVRRSKLADQAAPKKTGDLVESFRRASHHIGSHQVLSADRRRRLREK
jgi:hypothetical protein